MIDPIYTAMGMGDTFAEKQSWWKDRETEARKEGATFFRYTVHRNDPRLILIEAWKSWPDDQGEPRWFMTKNAPQYDRP